MARDHGRVLCRIWQDKDFRALPRTAQALYMQLLSQPNVNNAGVLPLMLSKWAKGCDEVDRDSLIRDLAVLIDARFVLVDTDTEEVLIRSFIRNDGGMKHKYIFKNALTMAEAVESPAIRAALAEELRRIRHVDARRTADILAPIVEPVAAVSESVPNAQVIPSESHSDPIENASESGMAFESDSDHCGVGEGEGVGESSVAGYVGGVARGRGRDARVREESPTPQTSPGELPRTCPKHPEGTDEPCRWCAAAREKAEAAEAHDAELRAAVATAAAAVEAEERRAAARARAAAIAGCHRCDVDGYDGVRVCDHREPPAPRPSIRDLVASLKAASGDEPSAPDALRVPAVEPSPAPVVTLVRPAADEPAGETMAVEAAR